jgi:hypothetical protein
MPTNNPFTSSSPFSTSAVAPQSQQGATNPINNPFHHHHHQPTTTAPSVVSSVATTVPIGGGTIAALKQSSNPQYQQL